MDAYADKRAELDTSLERHARGEQTRAVVHVQNIFHTILKSMGTEERRRHTKSLEWAHSSEAKDVVRPEAQHQRACCRPWRCWRRQQIALRASGSKKQLGCGT
ncbi:hypothetical protein OAO87_03560 [bacterium]|nr:hypothetical protein [bacterium]